MVVHERIEETIIDNSFLLSALILVMFNKIVSRFENSKCAANIPLLSTQPIQQNPNNLD
jgi:hypothetical protein